MKMIGKSKDVKGSELFFLSAIARLLKPQFCILDFIAFLTVVTITGIYQLSYWKFLSLFAVYAVLKTMLRNKYIGEILVRMRMIQKKKSRGNIKKSV